MLQFTVENQTINRNDNFNVVADSQNYLTAEFLFSDEWTFPATVVFRHGEKYYNVLLENNNCTIPWEVIKAPFFTVSVFCGERITSNVIQVSVEKSGYINGETPNEPTPEIYSQIVALSRETKELAQSVRNDADNGVFKGDDGYTPQKGVDYFDGKDGQDGYTPQKGIDYFDGKDGRDGINGQDGKDGENGRDGYTPIKGVDYFDGEQGIPGKQGIQGEPGIGGLIHKTISNVSSGNITVEPFNMTVIPELTAETTLTMGEPIAGYDNEWDFQITQGETAQQLTLPAVRWGLGINPVFGANSTTLCRLYYIGDILCGEWVCV